jgi:hypothetical protein
MNKVFDPFLGLFLRVFIDDFEVYSDRASHLAKLELVFQHLDSSGVTLNPEKTTIGFSEGKMVGHIVSKDGVATCRNPSFGLATKAKGITRVRAKGKPES